MQLSGTQTSRCSSIYKLGADCKPGNIIAHITFDLLSSWTCIDSFVNMVFYTTVSNVGHVTAGQITLVSMSSPCWGSSIFRLRLQNYLLSPYFLDHFDFSGSFSKTVQSFVGSCKSGILELVHSELLI